MDRIGYPIRDRDPNAPTGRTGRVVPIVVAVVLLVGWLVVAWLAQQFAEAWAHWTL